MIKLIHGSNTFTSLKELKSIQAKLTEVVVIDAEKTNDLNEINLVSNTYSMFDQHASNIIIKRLFQNKKKTLIEDAVESIIKNQENFGSVIFWEPNLVKSNLKSFKQLVKYAEISKHEEPSELVMRKWIDNELKKHKLKATPMVLTMLIEKIGTNQLMISNELEKLMLFAHSKQQNEIFVKDLEIVPTIDVVSEVWKIIDMLLNKEKLKAIKILNENLYQVDRFPLLISIIANQLKYLYLIKSGIPSNEIISELGVKTYTLSKIEKNAYKFELNSVKLLFSKLTDLDFAIKQGKMDAKLGLNLFLLSI
jgi:DNA polymerase III subunit delta